MKTSLKHLVSLLALGLCAAAPLARAADEPATPPAKKHVGHRLEKAVAARDKELTATLALTAEQQAKLAEIRKAGAEQIKAAAGDRAKMRALAKAQHDEVRALLTPEQQAKFDAMPVERRGGGKGKKAS